jgi:hypothetical protein
MDFRDETPKANKTKPKSKAAQTAAAKKKGAVLRNPSVKDVFVGQDDWDSDEDYHDAIEESPAVTVTTAKRIYPKRTTASTGPGAAAQTGNGTAQSK